MGTPPPFDKFEKLIGPKGKIITVHNLEPFGEEEIIEAYKEGHSDYRQLGITYRSFARTAKRTFPSGWAVAVGYVGEERMVLLDSWSCHRAEAQENLPYTRF